MKKYLLTLILVSACERGHSENIDDMSSALNRLCGKTFGGAVISQDPQDAEWRKEAMKIGPIQCHTSHQIEMPLAVGANKSRTWFLTGTGASLELRHQHLLADGSLDPVTNYGGVVHVAPFLKGKAWRAEFPADRLTVKIFKANDLEASMQNVWAIEVLSGETLTYELTRENRDFRAVFDLRNPL